MVLIYALDNFSDTLGTYKSTQILSSDFSDNFRIDFKPIKLKNGCFLNTFSTGTEEGYYQMLMLPNIALNLPIKRKTVFLIDYDKLKTGLTSMQIFQDLKNYIVKTYTPKDSFALFYSGFTIKGTGDEWIKGDSISIANAFNALGSNPLKEYSNLTSLLSKGSDFLAQKGQGDLIIIAASDHGFSPTSSTPIVNDYVASIKSGSRVFSIDLCKNPTTYYNNGVTFYGDGYFYSNVARLTKGNSYSIWDYSYSNDQETSYNDMLSKAVSAHSGNMSSFDIYTTMSNGFCSGRINIGYNSQQNYLITPVIQVGKYNGSHPFMTQFSGIFNGKAFGKNFTINENEISSPDSTTKTIWAGRYLINREKETQNNATISDIIDVSLANRALSIYTAFLALEPAQNGKICASCIDESKSPTTPSGLSDEQLVMDSINISVYPLPVTKEAKITIKDYLSNVSACYLKIYNMQGEVVKEIDLASATINKGKIELALNVEEGSYALSNGTYIIQYYNGSRSKKGKLVIQR